VEVIAKVIKQVDVGLGGYKIGKNMSVIGLRKTKNLNPNIPTLQTHARLTLECLPLLCP
jgi:hypothetical protein